MDERAALAAVADRLPAAGDDAAIIGEIILTTDMLHESTDFPAGTTRYTAGWRAVGASLSDIAAMGAEPIAGVAVYAAPTFDSDELTAFLDGAIDVCAQVDARYVGGDLDRHDEFTVASTVVGRTAKPVRRSGATPGEVVCVTGSLGRSGAAIELFRLEATDRANELFRFEPRTEAGSALAPHVTAMMDSSDGLGRSLHQLAEASGCGFAVDGDAIPIDPSVHEVADDPQDRRELGVFFGEDFELVFTVPAARLQSARETCDVPVTEIGRVTDEGLTIDGDRLPDRGYTHGDGD